MSGPSPARPGTTAAAARPAPVRSASAWSLLVRFWPWARPSRPAIVLGLLMIPLVAGLTATRPLLMKHAVDTSIPAGDWLELRLVGMLFLVAVVAEFLAQAVQIQALQRAGHATITALRRSIFVHVLRLPAKAFDATPIGSLLTRTTSDVEALSETLSFGVFTILTDVAMITAILAAMFALDVQLTLVALAVAPVLVLLVRFFSAALRRLQLEIRKATAVQTGYLAEQLAGITVVQLFRREDAASREFDRLGRAYMDATKLANIYDALLYALMDGIAAISIALLLYAAAPAVADPVPGGRALSLGLLFAFVDYVQRIFVPVREFSGKLAIIQRAAASLERIYALLDEPTEPREEPDAADGGAAARLQGWRGDVRIRGLRFAYGAGRASGTGEGAKGSPAASAAPPALDGIDLDIAPGEVVAVVGRTGSGKSSLGRVLTRTYDGYEGEVRLGDHELRTLAPAAVRSKVLMVQQDVFLFQDDAAFNVALGDPACGDPQRLWAALDVVAAREFIEARGGLEFEVGERGGNLSAGEQQLLAFARVAARDPTLLILDEATASVDSATEQRVQQAIERLFAGRTVLVIAHRLSTVRRADRIVVLERGRVVESGPHELLMAKGGAYAALVAQGLRDDAELDAAVLVPAAGAPSGGVAPEC